MKTRIALLLLAVWIAGCSAGSNGGDQSSNSCTPLSGSSTSTGVANQLNLLIGGHYINEITTSVTICEPGTSTCQTIPNVLVDTGSDGLRLFSCTVSLSLQSQTSPTGGTLAECVSYGDGTSHWGPVKIADVVLGTEKASNVPIEIIEPGFAPVPSSATSCTNLESNPAATGYNGILGVGVFAQDCGAGCTTFTTNGVYFSCSSGTCTQSKAPLTSQVTNPVSLLATDNNGVILDITAPGGSGSVSTTGTMTLGIDTQANNSSSGKTMLAADTNGDFKTTFNSTTYSTAFIDSGSNAYYFPGDSSTPTCTIQGFPFFCPSSPVVLSATQKSWTAATSKAASFTISNASVILATGNPNLAYSTYGGQMTNVFDWGLPFFMGKQIFVGISATTSSLGTGPYWAW